MKRFLRRSTGAVGLLLTALLASASAQNGGNVENVRRLNMVLPDGSNCTITTGTGTPEGNVVGKPCDVYLRKDTGTWWVKGSGTGTDTSGWSDMLGSAGSVTNTGTLTSGLPVTGNGGTDVTVGTRSGNTTKYVTTTGTLTSGDCVSIDADGNFVADGAACAGGGTNARTITFVVDGGGSAITAGATADFRVPYSGTIVRATLLADQTGSAVVDVWRDTYANYPPTVADTITASAKPTLSSAAKYEDATLTGWTTSFSAGDDFRFTLDSASTVTRLTLILEVN